MTPAIKLAEKSKIAFTTHQYQHDANAESYGEEAAQKLGLDSQQVFKTLLASNEKNQLLVAVVPVGQQLDLKALAKAAKCKKVQMADKQIAQRTTGYLLGGISPLAQKKALPTFIDSSAQNFSTIFVSAGQRGLEIELKPQDLAQLTRAQFSSLAK